MATIVFFHAHPDDEVTTTGGTIARLAAEGHRVVLVTATRGELGEVPEGLLAEGEALPDRRAEELAESCRVLGIARQVFLGYGDSGMAGEDSNTSPGAFAAADVVEAARVLAGILREERADVLVAYDEHGGYGHPDHVMVHRVGLRAAELADTPRVFMATVDRTYLQDLMPSVQGTGLEVTPEMTAMFETIGVPGARVTTEIDVRGYLDVKRSAMRAHASQIGDTGFFLAMSDDVFTAVWGNEWYVRVKPITGFDSRTREPSLLA
ncbi:MAG TPA: PIG-L family deacetylase [Acidimicrobiales bacterium]|jgi:LmbE family N-acetylglucosaminyl deacetylase|nr:PIG-L family deacetylase [Acidimicrobiales bacterium]